MCEAFDFVEMVDDEPSINDFVNVNFGVNPFAIIISFSFPSEISNVLQTYSFAFERCSAMFSQSATHSLSKPGSSAFSRMYLFHSALMDIATRPKPLSIITQKAIV